MPAFKKTALVTNAENHVCLATVRSLGKNKLDVTAISCEKRALSFYSRYCRQRVITSSPAQQERFIEELVEIVKDKSFDILLPAGWDTIYLISKYRNKLMPYTDIPIAKQESIEITEDKSETIKFALKSGIPCPRTFFPEEIDTSNMKQIIEEIGLPAVVKPNKGFGAVGIRYANSFEELEDVYVKTVKRYGPSIIQEFIKGKTYSSSALFNSKGQPRRACVQQGLRESPPTGGTQIYTISARQQEILECTIKLLKALKWYGIAELDFILDDRDQRPKLLEINPRLYSSVCLPIAAGVDYPYLLYRLATEGDVEPDFNYELGVKCRYIFPAEFKYVLGILRNKNGHNSRNPTARKALIDFIKLYEPDLNYFIMSTDDPMPAMINLFNYVQGVTNRKLEKIKIK